MLKDIMPVAVFVFGVAAGLEAMTCLIFFIMAIISIGVVVSSYGEVTINWVGVVYQMGGVVGEALRLIFIEIFVKKKGVRMNSVSTMYYVSPCSYFRCGSIQQSQVSKRNISAKSSKLVLKLTLMMRHCKMPRLHW